MGRIRLIIEREFTTRVRKKSFWVMALLGPVLFGVGMIVPLWLGSFQEDKKVIEVVDQSGYFQYRFIPSSDISFAYFNGNMSGRLNNFLKSNHYAVLYIPRNILDSTQGVELISKSRVSPQVTFYLEKQLGEMISSERLKRSGINQELINRMQASVSIKAKSILEGNSAEDESAAALITGLFSSVLILFFIVLYGGQVMRGVIEEKTNRIMEVIISSVRPFELMMGKIIGIALVSLMQFIVWIAITVSVSFLIQSRYAKAFELFSDKNLEQTLSQNPQLDMAQAMQVNQILHAVETVPFGYILVIFIVYFIGGYLLFAGLFAGIGSVVDSETDTQQFVFPLIAPLMFVMVMATSIVSEPHGPLAFWLSMIPFTSPVAMMLRLPFEVPLIQLLSSILILILSFILFTWLSSRVYRMGVLMYGKKMSFAEIGRLMFGRIGH